MGIPLVKIAEEADSLDCLAFQNNTTREAFHKGNCCAYTKIVIKDKKDTFEYYSHVGCYEVRDYNN